MPAGRPSGYDPAFCEQVIEWGAAGKSRTWIAANLGVNKDTIYHWEKVHPEFSAALTRAKLMEQCWWEDYGQDNMGTPGFSAAAWSRSMAARFRDDWADIKKTEISGQVQVEHKATIDPGLLSFEERDQLRALLEAAQARALPAPGIEDGEFSEVED